jgi:hypothetical protein
MDAVLIVDGRVTRRDSGEGVHGLTVEVWQDSGCGEECLGRTLTDRGGRYRVCGCPSPPARGPRRVFVRIRDREGRLIHDGRSASCACLPDAPATIDVPLAPETLWWHLGTPASWTAPTGPLVAPRVRAEVVEALQAYAPQASPSIIDCVLPPLGHLDGVLEDAWRTLRGDLAAATRLRDSLSVACAMSGCEHGGSALTEAVQRLITAECDPEPHRGPSEPRPPDGKCRGCEDATAKGALWSENGCGCPDGRGGSDCGGGCGDCRGRGCEPGCPCRPTLVRRDDVAIIVMAALHLSCGHAETAVRLVTTVLDQVCRLEFLGALHRSASAALAAGGPAIEQFRGLAGLALAACRDRSCSCPASCCEPCIDPVLERCLRDAVCAWRGIGCFRIDSVQPPRACPGDLVVVCGCGFGVVDGVVTFRQYGTMDDGPRGTIEAWCDTSFTVRVPDGAGCGMSVRLPAHTVEICGRFLDVHPHGCVETEFEGTAADILHFSLAEHSEGECVEPGTPLRVSWRVCAADRVVVRAVDADTGAVLDALDPAPDRGHWTFDGNGITRTTRVRLEVAAQGICQPPEVTRSVTVVVQARPDLSVHGIEVTQAIQHYRAAEHLTDPPDQGADNSLRLVVNKTAWVRVYLRSGQDPGFDGGQLVGISGTLLVERRVAGVWNSVAVLAPQNGPVVAEDSFVNYDAERGNIDNTLNFVLPAALMTGLLRLTVDVASPFAQCPGNSANGSVRCDVNLQQTLNAAFITIGYNGRNATNTGNLNLPAPTLAACQAETAWAMLTYPVSGQANVRVAGTFVTATPLDDPRSCPGCCSPNWGTLLPQVAALVVADQAANPGQWVYYGIIAGGIPVNVPGCNGVATGGLAGQPITYAHEIGHQFGLPHARCGNAGTGNANYPVYEPYDLPVDVPANPINTTVWTMASIGEYGLDINTGAIANPNDAEDFMSYCGPRWISKFTHDFLVNNNQLTPQVIPTGSGAGSLRVISDTSPTFERHRGDVEPLIHVAGILDADGGIAVNSVARLDARYLVSGGRRSGHRIQLLDAEGAVLAEDHVYRYPLTGGSGSDTSCCDDCGERDECGHPPSYLIKAFLDDVAPGHRLRIQRCGETVWEREAPQSPPAVSRVRARLDRSGDLQISWSASYSSDIEQAWIRYSTDGQSWNALTIVEGERSATVPADQLPSGAISVQVLVHDGFSTAVGTSGTVELPSRPPAVTILFPEENSVVHPERQLHLWGAASEANAVPVADEAYTWDVDGDAVGQGADIWVSTPGPGTHVIGLTVAGAQGSARSERTLAVREPTLSDVS